MMIDFALAASVSKACRRAMPSTRLVCCVLSDPDDHSGGTARRAAADVESGVGAELRRPLGIGMVGGLVSARY